MTESLSDWGSEERRLYKHCRLWLLLQERRAEKKANRTAFKEEKVRQEKQLLNVRANLQGLKL